MKDPIERQDVIDELEKISFSHWFECGEYLSEDTREIKIISKNKALEAIEVLPTAELERDKGEWIMNDNGTYSCSLCQSWVPKEQYCYARYCLYCGADMREKQND